MSDEHRWRRKCFVICLLALFIGLMGIVLPEQEEIAFEIIVNNTNLAPTQHGYVGTGERLNNTDYYANNSAIQIFLYAHTNDTGQWANIDLYINDTAVMHADHNFVAAGEIVNTSLSAIIPKGAKYKASFTSFHHFEWREYPIISGKNGTLSINQSFINNDIAIEYVVNNTDLYNNGRVQDVTYTANDSAIQIFLIFHALGTGSPIVIDTNLSINGTVVEDRDYRTSAGAGLHEHFSMTAHIPKGANYSVTNSSNLETMEWREYPILTGRNGTLSINITQGGGTGSQNLSQVLNQGNTTNGQTINFTNSGKWLNVGYNSISGLMEINTSSIFYYKQGNTFLGFTGSGFAYSAYDNRPMKFGESSTNYSQITHNATYGTTWYGNDTGGANGNLNITGFDQVNMYQELNMTNNSITSARNVFGRMLIAVNMNSSSSPFFFPNDAKSGLGADYVGQYVSEGNSPTMILTGFGNDSSFEAPAFSGIRIRGNRSSPMPLLQDDVIFGQGGRGWFGIGGDIASTGPDFNLSSSKIAIHMRAAQNWNVTAQGTKWYFYTTKNDTTTLSLALTLNDDGNLTFNKLSGSGNDYACFDPDGKLFRSNTAC